MGQSHIPKVEKIQTFEPRGPWQTKSEGTLLVLFTAPVQAFLKDFFLYEQVELKKIPEDIRGFRIYTVRSLPKGKIGGTEFHRIRKEIFLGLEGAIRLSCDDLYGETKSFLISSGCGIFFPPYIRHSYEVTEENSGFLVIANTLFVPEDPRTHDTYPSEEFEILRKNMEDDHHDQQKYSEKP